MGWRIQRTCCLALALCWTPSPWADQVANEHFSIDLPDGYVDPTVSRMSRGVTYAYTIPREDPGARALFQISIVEIPEWSEQARHSDLTASLDACLDMFMNEIGRRQLRFERFPAQDGMLDSKPMRTARWLGQSNRQYHTGVLHCARDDNRYFVAHMQDTLSQAPGTFANLKASLTTVRFLAD